MTDWPARPASIGQVPITGGIFAPPAPGGTTTPLLLPEPELDPDDEPELLLELPFAPELLLPELELEVPTFPLLLPEPEEPLEEPPLELLAFIGLAEPLLLALPPEELGAAAIMLGLVLLPTGLAT